MDKFIKPFLLVWYKASIDRGNEASSVLDTHSTFFLSQLVARYRVSFQASGSAVMQTTWISNTAFMFVYLFIYSFITPYQFVYFNN